MQSAPRPAALSRQAWGLASTLFGFQIMALVHTIYSIEEPFITINRNSTTIALDNMYEEDKSEMREIDGPSDRTE